MGSGGMAFSGSFPGGSNTFVKRPVTIDRNQGEAVLKQESNPEGVVRQVIDALQSTEEWQALTELVEMMKHGGGDDGAAVPGGAEVGPETGMGGEAPMPPAGAPGAPGGGMPPGDGYPGDAGGMPGGALPGVAVAAGMAGDQPATAGEAGGVGLPEVATGQAPGGGLDPRLEEQTMAMADRNYAPVVAAGARALGAGAARSAGTGAARSAGAGAGAANKNVLGGILQNLAGQQVAGGIRQPAGASGSKTIGFVGDMAGGPNTRQGNVDMSMAGGHYGSRERYSPNQETEEMEVEQFQAVTADNVKLTEDNQRLTARLAEVESHNESILTEQAEMYAVQAAELHRLTAKDIDSTRKERLSEIVQKYPVVDMAHEVETCCYSAGSEMSNDDFNGHCETIERYAAMAIPESPMIPVGVSAVDPESYEASRYAAQAADVARDIINQNLRTAGAERISYPDALKAAKEQLGQV